MSYELEYEKWLNTLEVKDEDEVIAFCDNCNSEILLEEPHYRISDYAKVHEDCLMDYLERVHEISYVKEYEGERYG